MKKENRFYWLVLFSILTLSDSFLILAQNNITDKILFFGDEKRTQEIKLVGMVEPIEASITTTFKSKISNVTNTNPLRFDLLVSKNNYPAIHTIKVKAKDKNNKTQEISYDVELINNPNPFIELESQLNQPGKFSRIPNTENWIEYDLTNSNWLNRYSDKIEYSFYPVHKEDCIKEIILFTTKYGENKLLLKVDLESNSKGVVLGLIEEYSITSKEKRFRKNKINAVQWVQTPEQRYFQNSSNLLEIPEDNQYVLFCEPQKDTTKDKNTLIILDVKNNKVLEFIEIPYFKSEVSITVKDEWRKMKEGTILSFRIKDFKNEWNHVFYIGKNLEKPKSTNEIKKELVKQKEFGIQKVESIKNKKAITFELILNEKSDIHAYLIDEHDKQIGIYQKKKLSPGKNRLEMKLNGNSKEKCYLIVKIKDRDGNSFKQTEILYL